MAKVDVDNNRVWVRPRDEKATLFVFRPERFRVLLDGEEAKPADIKQGQRATVRFVPVKAAKKDVELNLARAVRLKGAGSRGQAGGETTG